MSAAIHHINFIVHDLDAAVPVWERLLDMPVMARERLERRGVRTARFRTGGVWLILVQPLRADSVPGRFLAEHGEGFFLLSLSSADLDAEAQRLGEDWFDGPVRTGLDGWQLRDVDPCRSFGVQVQFTSEASSQTPSSSDPH